MNINGLKRIVQAKIDAGIARGAVINKRWLAHEVVTSQGEITGDGAEFAKACAYHSIQVIAGELIRHSGKQEVDDDSKTQTLLPGFEFVRTHYSIVRGKESIIVPIGQMSSFEIAQKVRELYAHARGADAHAAELARYAKDLANSTNA